MGNTTFKVFSLPNQEINTTLRCHHTPGKSLSSVNLTADVGEDVERKEPIYPVSGVAN